MNKKLKNWFLNNGSAVLDSDYTALLARGTALGYTLPSASLQTKQNTLVLALKAAGVWSLIDVLYFFKNNNAGLANFSLLNWKTPSSFACSSGVPPTYGVNGYTGNGSTQFLTTNWTPKTNGVNFALADCSLFGYQTENVTGLYALWGGAEALGLNLIRFYPLNVGLFIYGVNGAAANAANANGSGFWQTKRTSLSAGALFRNGSSVNSDAAAELDRPTATVSLLAYNVAGTNQDFSLNTIGCFGAGSAMSTQQSSDLYTAINNYFASL